MKHATIRTDLNERQVRLLRAIAPVGRSCPSLLAKALAVPKPFVSRTTERFVAMGLVLRKRDAFDKRKVTLKRLPAGDSYLATLDSRPRIVRAPTAAELGGL